MSSQTVEALVGEAWKSTHELGVLSELIDRADGSLYKSFTDRGLLGLMPIWGGLYQYAALHVVPGIAPSDWPGVLVSANGFAQTVSTKAGQLLSQWLLHVASPFPDLTDGIRQKTDRAIESGLPLHTALGGLESDWEHFMRSYSEASGDSLRKKPPDEAFENCFSSIARGNDQSTAFNTYADWLDSWRRTASAVPATEHMGCWSRLAIVRAWSENPEAALKSEHLLEELRRVVEETAGLDSSIKLPRSWGSLPGTQSARATIAGISRFLALRDTTDDSVRAGLLEAVRTEGVDYNGLAHAEAVPLFDERGDPQRAWEVLCGAAWWMARNLGEIPPAIFDAARLLCDKHGWDDVRWVVDQNAGASA